MRNIKNEGEEEETKRVEKEEKRRWGESRKKQSGGGRNVRRVKFIQGESGEWRENSNLKSDTYVASVAHISKRRNDISIRIYK